MSPEMLPVVLTPGEITITRLSGDTETIPAYIAGPLALHPAVGEDDFSWTVTHIRTGLAIVRGLIQRARAFDALKELLAADKWDTNDPRRLPPKRRANLKRLAIAIRDRQEQEAPR